MKGKLCAGSAEAVAAAASADERRRVVGEGERGERERAPGRDEEVLCGLGGKKAGTKGRERSVRKKRARIARVQG
jgi:hypothetical protein